MKRTSRTSKADGATRGRNGARDRRSRAIDEILDRFAGDEGALVSILQAVQDHLGHLSEDVIEYVASARRLSPSQVYGVATFYSQFRMAPVGKTVVKVCHGTACHVSGAPEITRVISEELGIGVGETADDLSYTLESVACLGCCGLAPVAVFGDETKGRLTAEKARSAIGRRETPCEDEETQATEGKRA